MTKQRHEHPLESKLEKGGRDRLKREWHKANERLLGDPEGAVTAARTILETTCKYALEVTGCEYDSKLDLPELYSLISIRLGMSAAKQVNRIHKKFFGSIHSIVQSIGEFRNSVGDAHGKGHQSAIPSRAEAELAVHLSGVVINFILSTLENHLTATKRLTSAGQAVLKFDKSLTWRLVDHATNSPTSIRSYGEKRAKRALWLVGDQGVYLMSNGTPPILESGKLAKKKDTIGQSRLVAYAEGCGPNDEVDNWWPLHNAVAEGSDFTETIPISVIRSALEKSKSQIVIVAGNDSYFILSDNEFDELPSLEDQ